LRKRIYMTCLIAAVAHLLVVSGCSRSQKGIVLGHDPVRVFYKAETNSDLLGAWTVQRIHDDVLLHIDMSDDIGIFGGSQAENMKNAAQHLAKGDASVIKKVAPVLERGGVVNLGLMAGFFKKVIWVMPTMSKDGTVSLEEVRRFLIGRRRYPASMLKSLKQVGTHVEGDIAGVPVTITSLKALDVGSVGTVAVDIDLAYLQSFKMIDPSYKMGTASALDFLRELAAKNIRTNIVTVNLSNQNGICPLDIRYFGDLIADVLASPEMLRDKLSERWTLMMKAEKLLNEGKYEDAAKTYDEITNSYPNFAGAFFARAVAEGFARNGLASRKALLEAMKLDSGYLSGFFQLARVLAAQGKVKTGEVIINTPFLEKILPSVELDYHKGIFYMVGSRPIDALDYLKKVQGARPNDFSLQTVLYRIYNKIGDDRHQIATLEKMRKIDSKRVAREMPWVYKRLGELYEGKELYDKAVGMYKLFLDSAPEDTSAANVGKRLNELELHLKGH